MGDAGGARRGQPAEVPPPDALARLLAALGHGVVKLCVDDQLGGEDDLRNSKGKIKDGFSVQLTKSRRSSMSSLFLAPHARWPVHLPTMPGAIRGVTNRSGHAA